MITSSDENVLGVFENHCDVGSVHLASSCKYDPQHQVYTIASAGANIWGDHDDFHFVWQRLRGDFIVTMRAEFVGEGDRIHIENWAGWHDPAWTPIPLPSAPEFTVMGWFHSNSAE